MWGEEEEEKEEALPVSRQVCDQRWGSTSRASPWLADIHSLMERQAK